MARFSEPDIIKRFAGELSTNPEDREACKRLCQELLRQGYGPTMTPNAKFAIRRCEGSRMRYLMAFHDARWGDSPELFDSRYEAIAEAKQRLDRARDVQSFELVEVVVMPTNIWGVWEEGLERPFQTYDSHPGEHTYERVDLA